jgi:hypothetical protein
MHLYGFLESCTSLKLHGSQENVSADCLSKQLQSAGGLGIHLVLSTLGMYLGHWQSTHFPHEFESTLGLIW